MTNSAKYAYYAPGLLDHARHLRQPGRLRAFGSSRARVVRDESLWND